MESREHKTRMGASEYTLFPFNDLFHYLPPFLLTPYELTHTKFSHTVESFMAHFYSDQFLNLSLCPDAGTGLAACCIVSDVP